MVIVRSEHSGVADDAPTVRMDSVNEYLEDQAADQEVDTLAGLREIDGANVSRFRIYRVGADNPELNGFLDEVGSEQISENYIRDKFGGGKYRVRVHLPNGRIAAHRRVDIAGDAPQRPRTATPSALNSSGTFDMQTFLVQQEAREDARRERARKERNELLTILVPAVAPIAAALIGNRGPDLATLITALKPPPAPTLPEMMQGLASLKALAPEQTTDPIDRALKLLDIIQDKAPTGGETGWLDIVKEVVRAAGPQVIGPALQSAMSRQSAMPASLSAPPSGVPAGAVAAIAAPVGSNSENPQMLELLSHLPWLKGQLTMALGKAARGSDPGLIAVRIVDDLPDGVDPTWIATLIARADWFEQLQKLEPQVTPFREWFTHMRDAMLAEFSPPPAPGSSQMSVTVQADEIDMPQGPPSLTGE